MLVEEIIKERDQYRYTSKKVNKVDKHGWRPITADGVYFTKDHANKTTSIKSRKTGKVYTGPTSKLGTQVTVNDLQMRMRKDELGEGDMAADKKAGIKWVDNPDWKKLHTMEPNLVKDFLKHKKMDVEEGGKKPKIGKRNYW